MTDKKLPSSSKMRNYQAEKFEIANELGTIHINDVEVNVKIASQNEAKHSTKTRVKHHNLNNPVKSASKDDA